MLCFSHARRIGDLAAMLEHSVFVTTTTLLRVCQMCEISLTGLCPTPCKTGNAAQAPRYTDVQVFMPTTGS